MEEFEDVTAEAMAETDDDGFSTPLTDVNDESPPKDPTVTEKKAPAKAPAPKPGMESTPEVDEESPDSEDKPEEKPEDAEPEFEIKVSGEVKKVKQSELIRMAQKGEAADRRFQDAARQRQEVEQFLQGVQKNPWSIFEAMGMDPTKAAEKLVWEKMVESQMSPAQRQQWLEKQRLAQLEQNEALRVQQAQQQAQQQQNEAIIMQYEPVLVEAQKLGVPDTDFATVRLIEAMLTDLAYGIEPTAKSLADRVLSDLQAELSAALGQLAPEQLTKVLGEKQVQKVAQARAQALPQKPKRPQAQRQPPARSSEPPRHFTTEEDFSAALGRFVGKGD